MPGRRLKYQWSLTATTWNTAQTVIVRGVANSVSAGTSVEINYGVTSVSDTFYNGYALAAQEVMVSDVTVPAVAAEDFSAVHGDGEIALSWTNPVHDGLSTVELLGFDEYYSPLALNGMDTEGLPLVITATSGSAGSHTVTGLTNGTEYIFWIFALDGAGNSSSVVEVTVSWPKASIYIGTAGVQDGTVSEDSASGATVELTVAVTPSPAQDVTVNLALSGAATIDSDYTQSGLSVSGTEYSILVSAATGTATFTLEAQADDIDDDETIVITLEDGAGYVPARDASATVTISVTDDDVAAGITTSAGGVIIAAGSSIAVDEGESVEYTLVLDTDPDGVVEIRLNRNANPRITVSPQLITFDSTNPWNVAQTITVGTSEDDDAVTDTDEISYRVVGYSEGDGTAVTLSNQSVRIVDDDTAGVRSSQSGVLTVTEGGSGSYRLELTAMPTAEVEVLLSSNKDMVTVTSSLTFTVSNWSDPQEVIVQSVANYVSADTTLEDATANISYMVTSGDTLYGGVAGVTLASQQQVRVTDVTVPAVAAEDFRAVPGTRQVELSWTNPDYAGLASVELVGFDLDLYGLPLPLNGTGSERAPLVMEAIPGAAGSHTVTDLSSEKQYIFVISALDAVGNSSAPVDVFVFWPVASIYVGSPGMQDGAVSAGSASSTVTVEVSMLPPPVEDVRVVLGLSGDAVINSDYRQSGLDTISATRYTLLVPAYIGVATFTLEALDDGVDDGDESIVFTLEAGAGYVTAGDTSGVVTISVTDGAEITVSQTEPLEISEGDSSVYTMVLNTDPLGTVTIDLSSTDTGAVRVSPARISFDSSNWNSTQNVMVEALTDTDAMDEIVSIDYSVSGLGGTLDSLLVIVADPPGAVTGLTATALHGQVKLSWNNPGDSDLARVNISATSLGVAVDLDLDDTERDDIDIEVTAGAADSYIVTGLNNDVEYIFTVVSFDDPGNYSGGVDIAVTPIAVVASIYIGSSGTFNGSIAEDGTTSATVTVALTPSPDMAVTVALSLSDDEAVIDSDYTQSGLSSVSATDYTILVPANAGSATFTLTALDDSENERYRETITITLRQGADHTTDAGVSDRVEISVVDDEIVTLNIQSAVTGSEDAGSAFLNWRSNKPFPESVELAVRLGSDSDTAGAEDYNIQSGTFTVAAGAAAGSFNIGIVDDDIVDYGETFTISISTSANGVVMGNDVSVVTITDNDFVTLSVDSTATVAEGDGSVELGWSLDGTLSRDVVVTISIESEYYTIPEFRWSTLGRQYHASARDYSLTPSSFTITAGTASGSLRVFITDDDIPERPEDFSAVLSTDAEGVTSTAARSLVTITDNDFVTLNFSTAVTVAEGGSGLILYWYVNRDVSYAYITNVVLSVSADEDPSTADASADDYTVTVTPGSENDTCRRNHCYDLGLGLGRVRGSIVLGDVVDDAIAEPDEVLIVTISEGDAVDDKVVLGTTSSTITIADDDSGSNPGSGVTNPGSAITPSRRNVGVLEGESASYDLVINNRPSADIIVSITNPDDGAVSLEQVEYTYRSSAWTPPENSESTNIIRVNITTLDDADTADETVILTHTVRQGYPPGVNVTVQSVSILVRDSDATILTVAEDASVVRFNEDAGAVSIPLALSSSLPHPVNVTVTYGSHRTVFRPGKYSYWAGGIATMPEDYSGSTTITIPENTTSWSLPITIAEDVFIEGGEVFSLDFVSGNSGVKLKSDRMHVQINDNDTGTIVPSSQVLSISESGTGELSLRLGVRPYYDNAIEVLIHNPDPGVISLSRQRLVFTRDTWEVSHTVEVAGVDDYDIADESVSLTFQVVTSDSDFSSTTIEPVVVNVSDDDTTRLALSHTVNSIEESGGQVELTLSLAPAVQYPVEVVITAIPRSGDIVHGLDYHLPGTVTIDPNTTSHVLTVSIEDDLVAEGDESFGIAIYSPTRNVGVDDPNAYTYITIVDNDFVGAIISHRSLSVTEGDTASYEISLSSAPAVAVVLLPASSDDSKVSFINTLLIFEPSNWHIPQLVEIVGVKDSGIDDDSVTITHMVDTYDSNYIELEVPAITVTAIDIDTVLLSMSPAVTVNEGATQLQLELTVSPPVDYPVPVVIYTATDSDSATVDAISGQDYTLLLNELFYIDPGVSSMRLTIATINDDNISEDNEVFAVYIGPYATGVTSQYDYTSVTIEDNDPAALVVSEQQLSLVEGGSVDYELNLASVPTHEVAVLVSSSDTATAAVAPRLLTFSQADWNIAKTVTVTAPRDNDHDNDNVILTHDIITGAAGYHGLAPRQVNVMVNDSEITTISIPGTTFTVAEDGTALELTLTMDPVMSEAAVVVNVEAVSDTDIATADATVGVDYVRPVAVSIDPGASSQTISLAIRDDEVVEPDEVLLLRITTPTAAVNIATAEVTVTITDNDVARIVLSATNFTVLEGNSSSYTVSLLTQPGTKVLVHIAAATIGTDSMAGSINHDTFTFTPDNWYSPQTVTITAPQDLDNLGGGMTLTHTASGGGYATASPVVVTVSIVDDDYVADSVYISMPSTVELSEDFGTTTVSDSLGEENSLFLSISRGLTGVLFLSITVRDSASGHAATAGVDYLWRNNQFDWVLGPGRTSHYLWPVIDDNLVEGDESFNISISRALPPQDNHLTITDQAVVLYNVDNVVVTIRDNDILEVSLESIEVEEDTGYANVPLSYRGVDGARLSATGVALSISTHDGTAVSGDGNDYGSLRDHEVVLSANGHDPASGTVNIPVPIHNDKSENGPRTFTVSVSSDNSSVRILDEESTVTIHDAGGVITIRIADKTVSESDGTLGLSFDLSHQLPHPVRLAITYEDGLAVNGVDYRLEATDVVIPSGVTSYSTAFPVFLIIDDTTVELDSKDFFIMAEVADERALSLNIERARIVITDTDSSEVSIVAVLQEGLSDSRLEITLTGAVEVPFSVVGDAIIRGEAASHGVDELPNMPGPEDISIEPFSIDVPANLDVVSYSVVIADDPYIEGDETFYLKLDDIIAGSPGKYDGTQVAQVMDKVTIASGGSPQRVVIADNDDTFAIVVEDVMVQESDVLAVLAPGSQSFPLDALDIRVVSRDGTAVAGRDYASLDYVVRYDPRHPQLPAIYVGLMDNDRVDGNINFYVDFSVEQDGVTETVSAEIVINDDDSTELSISPLVTRVDEDVGTTQLLVNLDKPLGYPLEVTLNVTSGTDQQPTRDYTLDTSFTINPGQGRYILTLTIVDDNRVDNARVNIHSNETYHDLIITPVVNDANISSVRASMVNIIDNDMPVMELREGVTLSGHDNLREGDGIVTITATVHPVKTAPVTVNMDVSSGNARVGGPQPDFSFRGGSGSGSFRQFQVEIPAGEVSASIDIIAIIDDNITEEDEDFYIDWSATAAGAHVPSGQLFPGNSIRAVIKDNDTGAINLELDDVVVNESDGSGAITLGSTGPGHITMGDSLEIALQVITIDPQAEQGIVPASPADYGVAYTSTTFDHNDQAPYQVTFDIVDDAIYEKDEIVRLRLVLLGSASSYINLVEDNIVDVTIEDNDPKPTLSVIIFSNHEEANCCRGNLFLSLSTPIGYDLTAMLATGDPAAEHGFAIATAGVDYTPYSETVTIPAGQLSVPVDIDITEDDIFEAYEYFELTVTMNDDLLRPGLVEIRQVVTDGRKISHVSDTVTSIRFAIEDNDSPRLVVEKSIVVYEGEGDGIVTVPVEISPPAETEVVATVTLENNSDDISLVDTSITFSPGVPTGSFAIRVLNDNIHEDFTGSEVVHILIAANAQIAPAELEVIVIDDDHESSGTPGVHTLIRAFNIYATPSHTHSLDREAINYILSSTGASVLSIDNYVPDNIVYFSVVAAAGATLNVNGVVSASPVLLQSAPITLSEGVNDTYIEVSLGDDSLRYDLTILYNYTPTAVTVAHPGGSNFKVRSSLQVLLQLNPPPLVDAVLRVETTTLPVQFYSSVGERYEPSRATINDVVWARYDLPVKAGQKILPLELRASDIDSATDVTIRVNSLCSGVGATCDRLSFVQSEHYLATILPLTAEDATPERRSISVVNLQGASIPQGLSQGNSPQAAPKPLRIQVNPPPDAPLPVTLKYIKSSGNSYTPTQSMRLADSGGNVVKFQEERDSAVVNGWLLSIMYPPGAAQYDLWVSDDTTSFQASPVSMTFTVADNDSQYADSVNNRVTLNWSYSSDRLTIHLARNDLSVPAGTDVSLYFVFTAFASGSQNVSTPYETIPYSVKSYGGDSGDYKIFGVGDSRHVELSQLVLQGNFSTFDPARNLLRFVATLDDDTEEEVYEFRIHGSSQHFRNGSHSDTTQHQNQRIGGDSVVRITVTPVTAELSSSITIPATGQLSVAAGNKAETIIYSNIDNPSRPVPFALVIASADGTPVRRGDYALEGGGNLDRGDNSEVFNTEYVNGMAVNRAALREQVADTIYIRFTGSALAGYGNRARTFKVGFVYGAKLDAANSIHNSVNSGEGTLITVVR